MEYQKTAIDKIRQMIEIIKIKWCFKFAAQHIQIMNYMVMQRPNHDISRQDLCNTCSVLNVYNLSLSSL